MASMVFDPIRQKKKAFAECSLLTEWMQNTGGKVLYLV